MDKIELEARRKKMYRLIDVWQNSGLSQASFCRQHGIAPTTFRDWLKRYKATKNQSSSLTKGFVPVKVEQMPNKIFDAELMFPNGISVRLNKSIDTTLLTHLINTCTNA